MKASGVFAPGAVFMPGMTHSATSVSQNAPYDVKAVMPKGLPFLNSMMPAMIWAMPP